MAPHPAVAAVRRAVRTALATVDGPVLVACSGGADSIARFDPGGAGAVRRGVACGLITVDHGLRDGSAERAQAVAAWGYELGLNPVTSVAVEVGRAGGTEAAARVARYAALDATDQCVLLGHTLDDQAETVLLGLGRGSGPRSIAGMRPVDGRYLRPLLGVRRATTRAACAALDLPVWDDPDNLDPHYQRVRLRREAIPLLEDILQGGVAEALARTATLVQHDLDALDALAAHHVPSSKELDAVGLAGQPPAVRTRVLRAWAHDGGVAALTATHVQALDALVTAWRGQDGVDLPGGFVAVRTSGRLELRRRAAPSGDPGPTALDLAREGL